MYPSLCFGDKVKVKFSRPGVVQRLWLKLVNLWRKCEHYDLYNEDGEKVLSNVESRQGGLEGRVLEVLNILKVVCPEPGYKTLVIGKRETKEFYFMKYQI